VARNLRNRRGHAQSIPGANRFGRIDLHQLSRRMTSDSAVSPTTLFTPEADSS
jgi:hypothetical protein